MTQEQVSIPELLLSLDSSELQEAELVRAAVDQQLNSDRGGSVLHSLVEFYLDSSSHQALLLLSSIRERHHKPLLEKLNEIVGRPGSRVSVLTLLGHLLQKQPPWVHLVCRSPLLSSLLRCLKTDSDVVVLITGVLVLITLLPMIPQAGKQHIYDFFDVFGRLASWSYKNPGRVPAVQLVHLHATVYSLFHRLYGMFPVNFMSYLRLHYSMKENLDTFQEVVKPMLQHVRVHPELVTGTQDYELDPSRWRCFEVHDIVLECSRVSLDPLESSCEEDVFSSPQPPPRLHLLCSPQSTAGSFSSSQSPSPAHIQVISPSPAHSQADDIRWSPSSHCGLSTPPPDPASSAHPLTRTLSMSAMKSVAPPTEDSSQVSCSVTSSQMKLQPIREQDGSAVFQPIREQESGALGDVISGQMEPKPEEAPPSQYPQPRPLSAPSLEGWSLGSALTFTPPHRMGEGGGPAHTDGGPAPSYEQLFELALPRAATLFIQAKTKEVLEKAAREEQQEEEEELALVSPLKVLDQLIVHGHDAHQRLSRRSSAGSRSGDRSVSGGKQQGMKSKGPAPQGEELQALRSQLLLVHAQLQYERFKRQQHAVRNRRLLRRVINATALEEHAVAMRAQLAMQEEELHSLKQSLDEEQRRFIKLQDDSSAQTHTLHTHTQQLLLQLQDEQREGQRLQSELLESQSRMRNLEAELQKANNKAYNAEHQLSQLSLKLSSSEQQQQQMLLMNQQIVVLKETNRALSQQLDAAQSHSWTEASMLQCSVGKEFQRLKESEVQHRQKLEAANQRTAELENQLVKKDQLIQEQKKLLEDTKAQSRCELSSSESRCVALRQLSQSLQSEMLQLYSQLQLDTPPHPHPHPHPPSSPQAVSRPNGGNKPRPLSSAVGVVNGAVETLSSSPLHLPAGYSSPLAQSPIESPLAVGSFLEQHARQLFGSANQSQEEAEPEHGAEGEEEEAQTDSPPVALEMEEAMLLAGSHSMEPPHDAGPHDPASSSTTTTSSSSSTTTSADLTLAVRQRRHELSIMDYDEMLPEF